jgi:hypothetical protein
VPSLHIIAQTSVSPEQFLIALTDFGPERGTIWGNSQSTHFILHTLGTNEADVTDGSKVFGGVWERLHYDWSKPGIVELHTTDSNIWANGSGWRYIIEKTPDGSGSLITAEVTRYPRSKKGYLILIFVGSIGKPLIKRGFRKTLRAIERQTESNLQKPKA